MKDPFDRTKVVLRHLPPVISPSALMEPIDSRFAGRYKWVCFRPGKNSQKHPQHSWAYIDFKKPEDVVEFAEFFDGHVFVNEKGTQFKTIVEYAPSQRVPKPWSKKDGREGTIFKDPAYLEFLELLAKPAENLPSAEIQLEKREAERAGAPKEIPIVTPLMDFVRQKRAAKVGSQRSSNGKLSRRAGGASPGNSSSASTKRGSEKRRVSTSMYVPRDGAKNTSGKDRSTYILVPRREDQQLSDKSVSVASATGTEVLEDESGMDGKLNSDLYSDTVEEADLYNVRRKFSRKLLFHKLDRKMNRSELVALGLSGAAESGKKKVLLLKEKEREISHFSGGVSLQQNVTSLVRNSHGSTAVKQNQRREGSGRMIKSILLNKEARQNQSSTAVQSEQQIQLNLEDKRPPQSTNMRLVLKEQISSISPRACISDCDTKRAPDDKVVMNDLHGSVSISETQEKRTRNKDRPDRVVWTPRRSDGSHASDESLSSSASQPTSLLSDSLEGTATGDGKNVDDVMDTDNCNKSSFCGGKPRNLDTAVHNSQLGRGGDSPSSYYFLVGHGEMKIDKSNTSRSGEVKTLGSGRNSFSSVENGSHRHVGRRGPAQIMKDADGSLNLSEGKPSKRGAATSSHEKQVWVQKSGSGS
ncbi:hypothetical protein HHK36_009192 [Tetracentron sinense]|uniref:UPF3 domain-containing protein n=1 Tax=Tetracentron sinense TaxID=13715 RepID=A0A834ZBA3_TETSI|nr:hypothetical protein HHK36_009192 [Tetracentron sinense]